MTEIHERLRAALHAKLPAAYALRRELHAEPYMSGREEPTLKRVLDALPDGTVMERVAGTGALLRIGGEGPAVGVRGELDALPIVEETGVPWASGNGACMPAAMTSTSPRWSRWPGRSSAWGRPPDGRGAATA